MLLADDNFPKYEGLSMGNDFAHELLPMNQLRQPWNIDADNFRELRLQHKKDGKLYNY